MPGKHCNQSFLLAEWIQACRYWTWGLNSAKDSAQLLVQFWGDLVLNSIHHVAELGFQVLLSYQRWTTIVHQLCRRGHPSQLLLVRNPEMTPKTVVVLCILKHCMNPSQSRVNMSNPIIVSLSATGTNRIFSLHVHYAHHFLFFLFKDKF